MTDPVRMTFGADRLSRRKLEEARDSGRPYRVSVAGLLIVDQDVTVELVEEALGSAFVNGCIVGCTPEVKAAIREKEVPLGSPRAQGKLS